jgi:hypothetical protein
MGIEKKIKQYDIRRLIEKREEREKRREKKNKRGEKRRLKCRGR